MAYIEGGTGTPSGAFRLKIEYTVTQSIANNTSDITMTGYIERLDTRYYPYNSTSDAVLTCGSNTYTEHPSYNLGSNGYKQMISYTFSGVQHNADGTLTINLGFSFNGKLSASYNPNYTLSQNITLPTIPRTSSFSAGDAYIEGTSTISINRASSSFTHTLLYSFGQLSGTIASGVGTSHTWTVPSSFYNQIPNSQSGTCTITCITYSDSTEIGRTSGTITITANETLCRPSVSGTVTDINNTTVNLTGDNSKLVRYKSTANVVGIATAKNGASISSITVNGGANPRTYTNCSIDSFTVVATDSRGYSNSVTITPTIIPYVILTNKATFRRVTQTGSEITLSYEGNYFNGSFGDTTNSLTLSWAYREKGTSTWNTGETLIPTISNNKYSGSISCGTGFNYQTDYEFIMYYQDVIDNLNVIAEVKKGQGALEIYQNAILFNGKELFKTLGNGMRIGSDLLNALYPIGSSYITSSSDDNPGYFLGGGWAYRSTFLSGICIWTRVS